MANIYSVKQINQYIGNMFSQDFLLQKVSVRGEVSNLKDHPTGHIYFTLKDADAVLSVVMFQGSRMRGLKCALKEGMKVVVSGNVDIYAVAGKYQLYAKEISDDGEGELYRRFMELKKELEEMGMFDPSFKKPIPKFVKTVGIVTASSGAALHDICQIAARRNPYVQLILSPAMVQGEQAAPSLIEALEQLDRLHPDVIIIGRGGGSQEDLWAFNDRDLARAIFDCDTPVISAVGHEVDFTIADFVSDLRAPTPSAAAELAVYDFGTFRNELRQCSLRMENAVGEKIRTQRSLLERNILKLRLQHPEKKLHDRMEHLSDLYDRMNRAENDRMQRVASRMQLLAGKLNALSPLSKLSGGFGYISQEGHPVSGVSQLKVGNEIQLKFHDGDAMACITEIGGDSDG